MTNHDSLRQSDLPHYNNDYPSQVETLRTPFPVIGLGLAALLATTAAGYLVIENTKSTVDTKTVDPEAHLRTLARDAILSGPESSDDIINTCFVDLEQGAYTGMYSAVDDAIRKQVLPNNLRDSMNRASYVAIEMSAIIINETPLDYATNTAITLFYKDINNDATKEIVGIATNQSTNAAHCRRR